MHCYTCLTTTTPQSLNKVYGTLRDSGERAVISRFASAVVCTLLVVLLVTLPFLLLPGTGSGSARIVALVCIFGALLTFMEYPSASPGLVEVRDAPPFNPIRFLSLLLTVFLLTVISRGEVAPTEFTRFVQAVAT